MVDAQTKRGEEGRTRLRKATRSCQETLIRGYPNGATQYMETYITPQGEQTRGSETSQYPQEKKSIEIPKVAASEMGEALNSIGCQQKLLENNTIEGDSPVNKN